MCFGNALLNKNNDKELFKGAFVSVNNDVFIFTFSIMYFLFSFLYFATYVCKSASEIGR